MGKNDVKERRCNIWIGLDWIYYDYMGSWEKADGKGEGEAEDDEAKSQRPKEMKKKGTLCTYRENINTYITTQHHYPFRSLKLKS
jgi:hypothetical protein